MRNQRGLWTAGLVVIALLSVLAVSGLTQSMAAYENSYRVVASQPGRVFQVPGVVDKGEPEVSDPQAGTFEFTMRDVETRSQSLRVRSKRIKPGNFDSAAQVVCVGRYNPQEQLFEADNILVKCPSKEVEKLNAAGG